MMYASYIWTVKEIARKSAERRGNQTRINWDYSKTRESKKLWLCWSRKDWSAATLVNPWTKTTSNAYIYKSFITKCKIIGTLNYCCSLSSFDISWKKLLRLKEEQSCRQIELFIEAHRWFKMHSFRNVSCFHISVSWYLANIDWFRFRCDKRKI